MTPQERKVFELALEFIERVNKDGWILADFEPQMYEVMTAINEALAKPEQIPPRAYSNTHQPEPPPECPMDSYGDGNIYRGQRSRDSVVKTITLAQQEPVAWLSKGGKGIWFHEPDASLNATPLYTTPPQRTWVDLTDEEVEEIERWVEFKEEGSGRISMGKLVSYISEKLRNKNT